MSISRRRILATAAALPAVSLLGGVSVASAAGGKTYYVAEDGNDKADGTSEGAPWQSINRVNEAFVKGQVVHGDSVLFKRGQRFYGEFLRLRNVQGGDGILTIGAYGTGEAPQILGYKILNKADAWQSAGNNLWQINLGDTNNYTGNTSSDESKRGNVGQLWVNGEHHLNKVGSLGELKSDWDFYSDHSSKSLTVRAPKNPAEVGEILVAVDGNLVDAYSVSNVTVQDLDLVGTGGHGVSIHGQCSGIKILNNKIRQIGGSYTPLKSGWIRYGNGIQVWIGNSDVLAEGNTIEDVFDVATTMQGPQEGNLLGWKSVHYKNNHITRCSQSFEVWATGSNRGSGAGYQDCSFTGNDCSDAGVGWGYEARTNKDEGGVHLLSYAEDLPMDLKVTGNRFIGAQNAYMYRSPQGKSQMVIDNNEIQLKAGQKLQQQRSETIEQHEAWSGATGFDKSSTFKIA
jgi:glycosyl hydrolase family 98 putative carbohydrate binding module